MNLPVELNDNNTRPVNHYLISLFKVKRLMSKKRKGNREAKKQKLNSAKNKTHNKTSINQEKKPSDLFNHSKKISPDGI